MDTATDHTPWRAARLELLEREKAHMRERDALARARRALPRVRIDTDYRFTENMRDIGLADLFGPHSQLAVYHFMFGTDWEAGCPSCSFWIDNLNGIDTHLAHRDTALVLVSSADWDRLDAYRRRMGWSVRWVSSQGSAFNRDFGVTFTAEEIEAGTHEYNFRRNGFSGQEAPGFSTFQRDQDGTIHHCYSTYGRGLDSINGAYQLLDLMPKGRDEDALPFTMAWLRRRDEYET